MSAQAGIGFIRPFHTLSKPQQRKSQTIADVPGEEGFAKNLTKADLEYLFAED